MTAGALFQIVSGLISIIRSIIVYLERQKWIDEGRAQEIRETTDVLSHHIGLANAAREQVRNDAARDPSTIKKPDPDMRPD